MFRIGTAGVWRPTPWLALAGEVRSEDLDHPGVYAAYARFKPWQNRGLTIDVGRIPPTFGAFSRHAYTTDNPVIGYPLAYQYLTSLRTDAVPAVADDLLRMRARGWRSSFPVGEPGRAPVSRSSARFRYDTGVQVADGSADRSRCRRRHTRHAVEPAVVDDNGGKQIAGRVTCEAGGRAGDRRLRRRGAWLVAERDPSPPRHSSAPSAPTSNTRAITGSSAARWSSAARRGTPGWRRRTQQSGRRDSAAGSKDATAFTPRIFLAARADRLGFSALLGSPAASARCLGCAGEPYRNRRRLLPAAQPCRPRDGSGELARRRPGAHTAPTSRRKSLTGSDDHARSVALSRQRDRAASRAESLVVAGASAARRRATGTIRGRVDVRAAARGAAAAAAQS